MAFNFVRDESDRTITERETQSAGVGGCPSMPGAVWIIRSCCGVAWGCIGGIRRKISPAVYHGIGDPGESPDLYTSLAFLHISLPHQESIACAIGYISNFDIIKRYYAPGGRRNEVTGQIIGFTIAFSINRVDFGIIGI